MNLRSELSRMYIKESNRMQKLVRDNSKCLERGCDYQAKSSALMLHVRRAHGLNRIQYLAKHNLPYDTKLFGNEYAEKMRKREEQRLKTLDRKKLEGLGDK